MNKVNEKTIGYYIGRFPGPTYFWREIENLRELGLSVNLVATRLTESNDYTQHAWTKEAATQTKYLFPLDIKSFFECLLLMIISGPLSWLRCIRAILRADGVTITERFRLAAMVLAGARLAVLGRQLKWAHIHIGFCSDAANAALFANLLTCLPYSLTLHSALTDFGSNQHQKWGHAAFGTAVAKNLAAELHEKLGKSLPKSLEAVSMGVDIAYFRRSQPYQPWNPEDGLARLLCLTRLTPRKGQQDLIKAVSLLQASGLDIHLRLIGLELGTTKWFTGELQNLIHELDLVGKVEILDEVPEDEVRCELEATHAFVLPSYAEGTSVAVMEAMAMGVPVVVTNVDGLPDLVDHNVNGLLVEPGHPEQLFEQLQFLLKDPELAVKFGEQGRLKVEQHFDSKQSARALFRGICCDEQ